MPKRTDLKTIMIIGSGPIVIGQACEFDYSGVQACKALRDEGYRVVLVNSNPATIMTDPEFSDATYIEPLTVPSLEKIIGIEKPDALLPTLGGQTGLNLGLALFEAGVLDRHGVKLIGANAAAIRKGEDRELFRRAMQKIGLDMPKSRVVKSLAEAVGAAGQIGRFPLIVRPSFTLGGQGGGIAYNGDELELIVRGGLDASPVHEVLIEECLTGWKEFEMEVMRDRKDQCVVICSIENIDPMGVHTGDSITVAPALTLSDKEYQLMRDASFAVIREIGVETGGSNVQFAVCPRTGRMVVIEMNPRVSRSSALASKATGFPIAKIAAKLAVGYSLDELRNDITRGTPAGFEPSIDYVVTKIPRFAFEKFPQSPRELGSSMKSVGEVMAIGRTFKESFQKALRSLENGTLGYGGGGLFGDREKRDANELRRLLAWRLPERIFYIRQAFLAGMDVAAINELTQFDPWFLHQFKELVGLETKLLETPAEKWGARLLRTAKEAGFSDTQLSNISGKSFGEIQSLRESLGIRAGYRLVDTCAAEFEARTPYYYSSYGDEDEVRHTGKKKIMVIGGGPNRIGQGIEFDYCCTHASFELRRLGYESVMINSNPETVSTDYDTSDHLYFEPLTAEDVLSVYRRAKCDGAIVQFGGQTPLNLARVLEANGVNIIGTPPQSIDAAEDREQFKQILQNLGLRQPRNVTATSPAEAARLADEIGFPILLRPSFVLGGRGMFIVYNRGEMDAVLSEVFSVAPGTPVLLDQYLEDAVELDVDCISDGETTVIGGMLEHVEFAGVHSGDATMVMPPHTLGGMLLEEVREATRALAKALEVRGLMNVQYAIKNHDLYVLEVNPRASRTIPFVSKVINVPLARLAVRIMTGEKLADIGFTEEITPGIWAVKQSAFPFNRFPGASVALGPEMRSTGEVMGRDKNYGIAFAKSQMAVNMPLPLEGSVFMSVKDSDKKTILPYARSLAALGFKFYATQGTANALASVGINATILGKLLSGRPNALDLIKNNELALVISTPSSASAPVDENTIRAEALKNNIPVLLSVNAAISALKGITAMRKKKWTVTSLQKSAGN
ncbi:carbamoyl-phosphate synthase large subunit [Ereboglobus sp. PH5-10]|uniref:carbamoyl-phosphate synthase large subunit n=1 Tax=Ereboglobus sp. PH5-10 TaxID=2940629 RepID=UPI0024075585|nr:carbamoyl-phosphate synthase large subunit [Ereboglobus sp. PH5-10]MDF9826830.1 carbamoyl-phosphate synthase large subunit [Ereboglobus sp. PH5-10]